MFSGHYGADPHLSGDKGKDAISRGVPIKKLMDENNLIVFAMNGQPLSNIHGGPVRLHHPRLAGLGVGEMADPHLGARQGARRPGHGRHLLSRRHQADGAGRQADEKNFKDLESMPVRSIITNPANGTKLAAGTRELKLRGAAWAGDNTVQRGRPVDRFRRDLAARQAGKPPKNKYDWQRWTATVKLPSDGYFEIWSRATDSKGVMQPHRPATGTRRAMAAIRCTASPCWSDEPVPR